MLESILLPIILGGSVTIISWIFKGIIGNALETVVRAMIDKENKKDEAVFRALSLNTKVEFIGKEIESNVPKPLESKLDQIIKMLSTLTQEVATNTVDINLLQIKLDSKVNKKI